MSDVRTGASSALFGRTGHTSVSRGLGEFHGRRPVLITATGEAILALPVEGLDGQRLAEFTALCGSAVPRLIVTQRRALALGLDASTPMALSLPASHDADAILSLVTDTNANRVLTAEPASAAAAAAIQLVKISQGLPAILAADVADHVMAGKQGIVRIEADAVARFAEDAIASLFVASEALVPLTSGTHHPLRRIPRRHGRQPGRHHRRQA